MARANSTSEARRRRDDASDELKQSLRERVRKACVIRIRKEIVRDRAPKWLDPDHPALGELSDQGVPRGGDAERDAHALLKELRAVLRHAVHFAKALPPPDNERASGAPEPHLGQVSNHLRTLLPILLFRRPHVVNGQLRSHEETDVVANLLDESLGNLGELPNEKAALTNWLRRALDLADPNGPWKVPVHPTEPGGPWAAPKVSNRMLAVALLARGWWPERAVRFTEDSDVMEVIDAARTSVRRRRREIEGGTNPTSG